MGASRSKGSRAMQRRNFHLRRSVRLRLLSREPTPTLSGVNSLMVIVPYKYEGMWVFDDPAVGLTREPFLAGIDLMIDRLVAPIPDAQRGFRAIFGAISFPGYDVRLKWRREESGGNWYYCPQNRRLALPCTAEIFSARAPRNFRQGGAEKSSLTKSNLVPDTLLQFPDA
jgi:hypothetical protein